MAICCLTTLSCFAQFGLAPSEIENEAIEKSILLRQFELKSGLLNYIKPKHSYFPTLGKFCELEYKLSEKAPFHVKMRLGSVDYVDKMENKRN